MSHLLIYIHSKIYKDEFSSIWTWIRCNNDVMYDIDWAIKCDVYPQMIRSCSKNISGISFCVLKISVVYQKYIIGVIA